VSQGDQLPQELAGYEELLVGAWRDLVVRIEEGYDDSLPEFQNDLGVRELLQKQLELVSDDEARAHLTREISEVDDRYRRATRSVERPINGRDDASWWWVRVPRKLRGDAQNTFAGAGFTSSAGGGRASRASRCSLPCPLSL